MSVMADTSQSNIGPCWSWEQSPIGDFSMHSSVVSLSCCLDSGLNAEAGLSSVRVGFRVEFKVTFTGQTYAGARAHTHRHTHTHTHIRTNTVTCTQATSLVDESETWTHVPTQPLDLPLHEVITNSRRINRVCNIILIVCLSWETSAIHNRNK